MCALERWREGARKERQQRRKVWEKREMGREAERERTNMEGCGEGALGVRNVNVDMN